MVSSIPRVVIAAPGSGHGKTSVTTGLLGALRARATGVDTRPKPSGKPVHRPETPVKIIDLAAVSTPK